MAKYCLINLTTDDTIPIDTNEFVVGREIISNGSDFRIPQKHAMIKVQEDKTLLIIAMDTNPIFYKTETEDVVKPLLKNSEIYLRENDKIGFLRDQFWFRISAQQSSEIELNSEAGNENIFSANDNDKLVMDIQAKNTKDANQAVKRKLLSSALEQENILSSPVKTLKCDSSVPISTSKESNSTETELKVSSCINTHNTNIAPVGVNNNDEQGCEHEDPSLVDSNVENVKIKKDGLEEGDNSDSKNIKGDAQGEAEIADSSSSDLRPSCDHGIRCKKQNRSHTVKYAHPEDNDYRRPNFSHADDNAPDCPFGIACYRRHQTHFENFKHPSSNTYEANPNVNRNKLQQDDDDSEEDSDSDFDYDYYDETSVIHPSCLERDQYSLF